MSTAADHADQILDDWLLDPSLAPPPVTRCWRRCTTRRSGRGDAAVLCRMRETTGTRAGHLRRLRGGDRSWRAVAPHGTVHAATLMHRREPGLVHARGPYPIVDVELDSGHRLVMTTARPTDTAPRIGTAVHIAFRRLGDVVIPAIDTLEEDA